MLDNKLDYTVNLNEAGYRIVTNKPFRSTALIGQNVTEDVYAVASYGVTIAILDRAKKVANIDITKYSSTTTRHQNIVQKAIAGYHKDWIVTTSEKALA